MKNNQLLGEDLMMLQKQRGNICISVILPTHRLFPERKVDKFNLEKAVENVILLLETKYGQNETKSLVLKLKDLVSIIDYDHNLDGIGLYISDEVNMMVKFPFPVKEKIVVDTNFEIRDLLYKNNISLPYYTLLLSEKKVRLFESVHQELTEIKGKHFPLEYYDDREYSASSRGSSNTGNQQLRSFEHDKSTIQAVRFQDFFRQADEYLGDYMVQETPLIIVGTDKDISWFEGVTAFPKHIVGHVPGSFDNYNIADLGQKSWQAFELYLKENIKNLILEFKEKIGFEKGISGIQDIWTAVLEGKGQTLLVEKDYKIPGFTVPENEHFITLRPPKGTHQTIPDAIDEIIETMLVKGGEVFFTENEQLREYGGMVLMTRY